MTNRIGTPLNPVRNTRSPPALANERPRTYHPGHKTVTFGIWREPEANREAFVANQVTGVISHALQRPLNSYPTFFFLLILNAITRLDDEQLSSCQPLSYSFSRALIARENDGAFHPLSDSAAVPGPVLIRFRL